MAFPKEAVEGDFEMLKEYIERGLIQHPEAVVTTTLPLTFPDMVSRFADWVLANDIAVHHIVLGYFETRQGPRGGMIVTSRGRDPDGPLPDPQKTFVAWATQVGADLSNSKMFAVREGKDEVARAWADLKRSRPKKPH